MAGRFCPRLFFGLLFLLVCLPCALLAAAAFGAPTGLGRFTFYLAQGYGQMAAQADLSPEGATLRSYFRQRQTEVARTEIVVPQDLTNHALDPWTLREAG